MQEGGEDFEEELASRPESWYGLYQRDTSARDSWQGRMTRAILNEWRKKGGREAEREGKWYWELGATVEVLMSLPGIIEMENVVTVQ